jgi:arginyl-tRNA--protein-N-Asp/Glu arginylyltransferase
LFSEERYELYLRYLRAKHGAGEGPDPLRRASYASFLLGGALRDERGRPAAAIVEYRRAGSGRLLANGYVDILPGGLSSVYFAFDPSESRRSLGTWSVAKELELAKALGKRFYYLGFWVPGSPKMDYKAGFRPFEYASSGAWLPARDRGEAAAAVGAA